MGRGGGGGGGDGNWDDAVWSAVCEAVKPIAQLEQELDETKLQKKLYDYFKKGTKNLNFRLPFEQSIVEYCDTVFGSIFSALGDRDWLAQADFLFCVDAAVKELFPQQSWNRIPQASFEQTILEAVDTTYDRQRYEAKRWETTASVIQGKKTQSKVRDALDQAREAALLEVNQTAGGLQGFLMSWIAVFVQLLAAACDDDPRGIVEEDTAIELFDELCQEGSLPIPLVAQEGVPPAGWPLIGSYIWQAYAQFPPAGGWPRTGKGQGKSEGKGKGMDMVLKGGKSGKALPSKGKGKTAGKACFARGGDDVNSIPVGGDDFGDSDDSDDFDFEGELAAPPAKRFKGMGKR